MGEVKIQTAIVSVTDKTGVDDLCKCLKEINPKLVILSTGGTAKFLREKGIEVKEISEHTKFPELMDGRVKTLHPVIHGGLLGKRDDADHVKQMEEHHITPIDLVIVNLYAFEATVSKPGCDFATAIENIDIGGPSMIRSSAKNHASVTVVTSVKQYEELKAELKANGGATTYNLRRKFAAAAYALTASYDAAISQWFYKQEHVGQPAVETFSYTPQVELKYGCNPHQTPSAIYFPNGTKFPLRILNGTPGYINLLDAFNAWQMVKELSQSLGLAAAASFKHVSPAGAGVAVPLNDMLKEVYEIGDKELTPAAVAYVRARQADPMCSYGDFAAISEYIDVTTAAILKVEVSDGIIAPGYDPKALEILKAKKGGKYVVLEIDKDYVPNDKEIKEVFGFCFSQKRNDYIFTKKDVISKIVTSSKDFSEEAIRDLILASIAIKYTQSNSVGYAVDGQMIGVGAGQQSRVDCTKLAGRKAELWFLRQHPKVRELKFKQEVKRQDRINARVRYIEGDFTPVEYAEWQQLFSTVPQPLTAEEKREFISSHMKSVCLSSDAFFPFRDNIDQASLRGVKYICQPGGSVADQDVIKASDAYGMVMSFSGVRLFHH